MYNEGNESEITSLRRIESWQLDEKVFAVYQNPDDLPPGGFLTLMQDLWSVSRSSTSTNREEWYLIN